MHKIHLRPATPSDVPRMISILIDAFAHGPWSATLFPPHLRTKKTPGRPENADQIDFRTKVFGWQLGRAGHRHVVAVEKVQRKGKEKRGEEDQGAGDEEEEAVVVGWAHWYLASHDPLSSLASPEERTRYIEEKIWGTANPPGLDKDALKKMMIQGEEVESLVDGYLSSPGKGRGDAVELHYLMVDPQHQRKGVGGLLLGEGLKSVEGGRWGEGEDKDGKGNGETNGRDVYLRSTVEGRGLYLAHGFEEVGEGTVFGERQFPMVKRK